MFGASFLYRIVSFLRLLSVGARGEWGDDRLWAMKKAEAIDASANVSEMRIELTRPNGHYPLKVARLPIPPPGQRDSKRV